MSVVMTSRAPHAVASFERARHHARHQPTLPLRRRHRYGHRDRVHVRASERRRALARGAEIETMRDARVNDARGEAARAARSYVECARGSPRAPSSIISRTAKHGAEQHVANARSCSRTCCTDATNMSATTTLQSNPSSNDIESII